MCFAFTSCTLAPAKNEALEDIEVASSTPLTDSLIKNITDDKQIPISVDCKNRVSLNEEFKSCDYQVGNDIKLNLMISLKTGRHNLTVFKQNDYELSSTKYFFKGGNYWHSCLIIQPTNAASMKVAFISVKDGSIVSDWGDKKCEY